MADIAQISSVENQAFVVSCIGVAALSILYYDYFLTLSLECSRFWASRRLTWASTFFYLNRYLSLFGHVPVAFQYFWRIPGPNRLERCIRFLLFHQYLAVVIQVIVGILLIMRTYALYNCRKSILLLLCSAGLVVVGFGIWCVTSGQGTAHTADELPLTGCHLPSTRNASKRLASAWAGMFCFDILIFSLTLYKSLTHQRGRTTTILHVMMRDGTIYFGVMMAACVSVIISLHISPSYEQGLTTTLTNVISSTMISRLMLNIRNPKLNSSHRGERLTTAMRPSQAVFTSIITTSIEGDDYYLRTHEEPATKVRHVDIELELVSQKKPLEGV
ncbi:hypothetical protein GALMADRAFT_247831 [Galerina marginata CBS 339.88]|uniref:DUF6533 domain-containing protein n=1 Tax=Galerina marginata (strain CBS 339.88) TaxID=685588 RepID=A0A067SZL6_GALM3|nr:hypothetical protein GALMADRAFT_247831 [Galerina marginata CBS 339.88]